MNNITILSETLANQIAAGEVVERPASVVKELVENAIDSNAKNITITIRKSGKDTIKVVDDGRGMSKDDAILAFERHATSKIKSVEDLSSILTLGFRGEALPSISSVANVTLTTSFSAVGTKVFLSGGTLQSVKEVAFPKGTSIEVNNLFFNTPARLKFLKSDTTELSHITNTILKQSLSKPEVCIRLKTDKRTLIDSPSIKNGLKNKIASLFGEELSENLIELNYESNGLKLTGLISNTSYSKSNREHQYVFINNRFIKDKVLNHAISQGYLNVLPNGRFPVVFLYLNIPPDLVDVNVHPAKMEVRFLNQQQVHAFFKSAITNSLYKRRDNENIELTKTMTLLSKDNQKMYTDVAHKNENEEFDHHKSGDVISPEYVKSVESVKNFRKGRVETAVNTYLDLNQFKDQPKNKYIKGNVSKLKEDNKNFNKLNSKELLQFDSLEGFIPLGQLRNSFIILSGGEGLLLIDQHTAHERIIYERLKNEYSEKGITIQNLIIPEEIEVNKASAIIVMENLCNLKKLGFDIEPFGDNVFIIRAVPYEFSSLDFKKVFLDISDTLLEFGKIENFKTLIDKIITKMACRVAVKANKKLDIKEIKHLLDELERAKIPFTCPHGRPIAVLLPVSDIEKKFLR